MPKLTKSIVENAAIKAKQYIVWCSDLKGFGACIHPSGQRSYVVDYTTREAKRRRMTIGRHGAITTEQARKLAIVNLGEATQGEDPQLERVTKRKSKTVSELCDEYMSAARRGLILGRNGRPKKSTTLDTDQGRIDRHIKPLLGSKRVIDLTRSDVSKFIRDVSAGKTAIRAESENLRGQIVVTGGAGTAARTAGFLGGVLTFAVSEGIIPFNPAHGVKRPADGKRERRLTESDYRALGAALDVADVESWQAIAGIRLLALTGCRFGEIRALKWSEVDLEGQCLRLGDSKTGASIRPLGKSAIAILSDIEAHTRDFVFYGVRDAKKPFGSLDNALERITAAAKLEGVTAHVLRHSFASVAADMGFADSTIGAIIGHAGSGITSRYIHRLDSVLIAAADQIAREVQRQMAG